MNFLLQSPQQKILQIAQQQPEFSLKKNILKGNQNIFKGNVNNFKQSNIQQLRQSHDDFGSFFRDYDLQRQEQRRALSKIYSQKQIMNPSLQKQNSGRIFNENKREISVKGSNQSLTYLVNGQSVNYTYGSVINKSQIQYHDDSMKINDISAEMQKFEIKKPYQQKFDLSKQLEKQKSNKSVDKYLSKEISQKSIYNTDKMQQTNQQLQTSDIQQSSRSIQEVKKQDDQIVLLQQLLPKLQKYMDSQKQLQQEWLQEKQFLLQEIFQLKQQLNQKDQFLQYQTEA